MALKNLNLDQTPDPGQRYILAETLGSGSYGNVILATDTQASKKQVAIKIQKSNEVTKKFIENEYKVLRDLSEHSNLPDFYGVYQRSGEIWFVMELCEGGTAIDLVTGLLAKNRRMIEEHIAYILKETVKGLLFLHENNIVHRDVRAKNILLTKEGEIKLADFGSCSPLPGNDGKLETRLGSPCWMAPEVVGSSDIQYKGYDLRADVWSLGITAIELGDGKAPFQTMHPTRTLFQIVTNPPPTLTVPSNWSEKLNDFIAECLVKNAEHRPYVFEVIEHPFLTELPENNYHLTLEIKSLVEDVKGNRGDQEKSVEIAVYQKSIKCGPDGSFIEMYVEDLASLDTISEKTVMKELENRMKIGKFQTFVGDVLVILNPNEKRNVYGPEYHRQYCMKSRSDYASHIFTVADSAYQNALHHLMPQRIILSGESGSGKTTNYLHLVDHLLYLGENQNISLDRLKNAIKLIHSLTHASTPTNNYSTRCAMKTDIKYGKTGKVNGAVFTVTLLEKWRVSSDNMLQGNFHFLYYFYDGLEDARNLEKYSLNSRRQHRYLKVNDNFNCDRERNVNKFKKILSILEEFGFSNEDMETIYRVTAAILIIGEIQFRNCGYNEDGTISIENKDIIQKVSNLLKIDSKKLEWALTNYCLIVKGVPIKKSNSSDEAKDARDVLANTLYKRLVDYIVAVINHKLAMGLNLFGEKFSVQIFDYFGFECFKKNYINQLLVNTFNEQMQYHYYQRIFSWECMDVNEEELECQAIKFYENKDTLDLLLCKSEGVFSLIDEASKQNHSGKHVLELMQKQEKSQILIRNNSEFAIAHYTGKVSYDILEMPEKNRDFLPQELTETLRLSEDNIIKTLFSNKLNRAGNVKLSFEEQNEPKKNRYQFQTSTDNISKNEYSQVKRMRTAIGVFKSTCLDTLKELSIGSGSGGTHFVRCLRTDLHRKPGGFNKELIKQQVRALGIVATAQARQNGYPHRIPFSEFLRLYQFLAFDFDENVEINRDNCRLLLIRLKMEGWAIGKSKVFLKYYNEEYLSRLYETQVRKIIKIQSILRGFLTKCKLAKEMKEKNLVAAKMVLEEKSHQMTEEDAAAIIQRAYRESNIKKSYPDFAKDYKVLDEKCCKFIKPYAKRWKCNSVFSVLLKYRAMKMQEIFSFCQQIHLYNLASFESLQTTNSQVNLNGIDRRAQPLAWLGEPKPSVLKVPFHLNDIPFYDTSGLINPLTNAGVSGEKDDAWDTPYRWRELISSGGNTNIEAFKKDGGDLINLPFTRDPSEPLKELADETEEMDHSEKKIKKDYRQPELRTNKNAKEKENFEVRKRSDQENRFNNQKNVVEFNKIVLKKTDYSREDEFKINCNAKPANEDFDYIKPQLQNKPKKIDPVAELREIGKRDSDAGDDEPPFNFQGMLRKTNFRKESMKRDQDYREENRVPLSFKPRTNQFSNIEKDRKMNGFINETIVGRKVVSEIAPGIIIEGIEVEL